MCRQNTDICLAACAPRRGGSAYLRAARGAVAALLTRVRRAPGRLEAAPAPREGQRRGPKAPSRSYIRQNRANYDVISTRACAAPGLLPACRFPFSPPFFRPPFHATGKLLRCARVHRLRVRLRGRFSKEKKEARKKRPSFHAWLSLAQAHPRSLLSSLLRSLPPLPPPLFPAARSHHDRH